MRRPILSRCHVKRTFMKEETHPKYRIKIIEVGLRNVLDHEDH